MTIKNIKTQYDLGRPEWEQQWQSHTHQAFQGNEGPIERPKNFKVEGSQVCFGTEQISYESNMKSVFTHDTQKALCDKLLSNLFAILTCQLGDDRTVYKTAAMTQFSHPSKQQMPQQPTYKNYNQRVDIITGQVYDQNKRSSAYEGFTEDKQHKMSQNQTILPSDLVVTDPITGRQIIRKGKGLD